MPSSRILSAANGRSEEQEYIAFISYRHCDLDRKAAQLIQKRIETYTIPKQLRSFSHRKKLGKVFRDEDELPLSRNLTESIKSALCRSRFLIVICSPDLPQSMWCEEEIRFFQQMHGIDNVIAVLVDGTPKSSFSPRLIHLYDENDNIIKDVEPLAANIVGKNHSISRKALKKEIVRIYAALIGCPFDLIWQRERRRKRRRAITAAAAAAVLTLSFGKLMYDSGRTKTQLAVAEYQQAALEKFDKGNSDASLMYYAEALSADPSHYPSQIGAMVTLQNRGWYSLRDAADDCEIPEEVRYSITEDELQFFEDHFPDAVFFSNIIKMAVSGNGAVAAYRMSIPEKKKLDLHQVVLVDTADRSVISVTKLPEELGGVVDVCLDYDGSHFAVVTLPDPIKIRYSMPDHGLYLFQKDGTFVTRINLWTYPLCMGYNPRGDLLLIGKGTSVRILDADSGAEAFSFLSLENPLKSVFFAEDGSLMIADEDDRLVQYDLIRIEPASPGLSGDESENPAGAAADVPMVLYSYKTKEDPSLLPQWYLEKPEGEVYYTPVWLPGDCYLYSDQKSIILRDKEGTVLDSVPFDVFEHGIATQVILHYDENNSLFYVPEGLYGGEVSYFAVDEKTKKIVDFRTVKTIAASGGDIDFVEGGFWVKSSDNEICFYQIGDDTQSKVVTFDGLTHELIFLGDDLLLRKTRKLIPNASYTGSYIYDVRYGAELWDLNEAVFLCSLEPSSSYEVKDVEYKDGVLSYTRSLFPYEISDGSQYSVMEGHSRSDAVPQESVRLLLKAAAPNKAVIQMMKALTSHSLDDTDAETKQAPHFTGNMGSWENLFTIIKNG